MTQRPGDADQHVYQDPPPPDPEPTLEYEDNSSSGNNDSPTPPPDTDTTTQSTSNDDSQLILPGTPLLWFNEDTDEWWVVYEVPQTTMPDGSTSTQVFTAWLIPDKADLTAIVGPGKEPKADFSGTTEDFTNKGLVDLGEIDELRNFDNLEGDPFDTWVEDMAVLAQTRPWILDADWVKLAVQASMERADGRVSLDEIKTTKWWIENSGPERAWMELVNGDPATADQMLENNRINTRARLESAGIGNATDEMVYFMADMLTKGTWSAQMMTSQIIAISDPYASDKINDELFEFMATSGFTPDQTQDKQGTVKDLLQEWLGPMYGNWSDSDIAAKAGELRNDPDGEVNFVEYLKDQRMAMYPGYTDRNISYAAAARPWSTFLTNQWGFVPDETDDVFQKVMQVNDPTEGGKIARRTGFDRGYEKVVNSALSGIGTGSRSNVTGAV